MYEYIVAIDYYLHLTTLKYKAIMLVSAFLKTRTEKGAVPYF